MENIFFFICINIPIFINFKNNNSYFIKYKFNFCQLTCGSNKIVVNLSKLTNKKKLPIRV